MKNAGLVHDDPRPKIFKCIFRLIFSLMPDTDHYRISSIDILRAITMLLMIFVNDLWSLKDIPRWLEHVAANEDGMGLADTVFPAFLFIAGMSIPLAVNNRRKQGDGTLKISLHISERSIALMVMGLFLVNGENINESETGLKRVVWNSLSCFSFILIWNAWPKKMNAWIVRAIECTGIIILLLLAFLYRGGETGNSNRFSTYWWGILGLIGWAYLTSALVYTFSRNKFSVSLIAWIVFNLLCIGSHAGWLPTSGFFRQLIAPLGDGAMPAFIMGGTVTTIILLHFKQKNDQKKLMIALLVFSLILFLMGIYARTFWDISKIRATPPWVFICSAITIAFFVFFYWLADIKGKSGWFSFIKPAGNNTLLCYLLPYFAYALVVLLHLHIPETLFTGGIGLIKSLLFALLMVTMAGWLGKAGIRLKL